nr:putative zinc finger, CCHC-type [Tanacetum cinerariifolium]
MPLNDPSLLTALKAQIQIGGTPQVNTFQATFHYQMAYRVQNHSLDILVPGQDNAGDALLIDVDSNATSTWIHMIMPTNKEPAQEVKHIWWDVCNCKSCLDEVAEIDDDEDLFKKRKSSQQKLKRRYEKEPSQPPSPPHETPPSPYKPPPTSPPPPKLSPYKQKALSILHQDSPVFPITKDPSCSYSQEYEQEFPALTVFEHLDSQNAESTVQFDAEDYEEQQENPNQETLTEFPKSDIKQYFTFDDVPPLKWRKRSIEMLTWCTAELQYYTIDVVIKRFLTRLQECLRDCLWEHTTHAREEFLRMKYCSFQKKDLEKHYDRMSQRFYCLNGVDDVNLKQVFLNFFPESLGNEAYQALEARNNQLIISDLESLYSLDDKPSDSVLCTIAYSDFSSDDDSDSDSLKSDYDFVVHMINPIPHVLPIQEDPPLSLAKIHLLTDAYAKPIPVIAFFDTDVNPTKASHSGMNPDHYQLAKEECEQLVSQGIIEPTTSPWACEAFYVSKRSEQVCGKLRLVINYQPLNHFLADDKFPLPQKKSLFQHLADAKVLFKFDLKSGFWQLGIKPEDRPKMAFCIPDHHYQWKWTSRQTKAVKAIKCLPEKMSPLKIHASSEKRILQIDASDECWGAVLVVQDNNNKRHVCGYKSGTFKAFEQHYHYTFKEILAVK